MAEKLKLEIPLLLPENGDCADCVGRLQDALRPHKGIEEVHVDLNGNEPRLCLHYDPNLLTLEEVERQARQEGITVQQRFRHRDLPIAGMDCADCAIKLEKGVGRLDGVIFAGVDFASGKMRVAYDVEQVQQADISDRVRRLGYRVIEGDQASAAARPTAAGGFRGFVTYLGARRRDVMTVAAGGLILIAFLLSLTGAPALASNVIYGVAIVVGGFYAARKGIAGVWYNRELDMNILMTLAAVGAAAIGAWAEGALVTFLFSLGETLEGYTMDRARGAIRSLMELAPAEATVLRPCIDCDGHLGQPLPDGNTYEGGPCPWCTAHEETVQVAELVIGDTILVRPGERIPMDGAVSKGASPVNQAPITGESVPVERRPGDEVFAGTINGSGALEIQVTHLAQDSTISRIIHMVEEAQGQKAPSQRWVDVFARYYTPAVVVLAVLIAVVPPLIFGQPFLDAPDGTRGWFYRALSLLIIACPCALVISTPVSIVSAISNGARNGVLIKGGAYLEAAGSLKVVAFDKTGTLTQGKPAVTDVIGWSDRSEREVLALAAAVEGRSEHPLARAVVAAAMERGVSRASVEDFEAHAGRGASGIVEGVPVHIGNRTYFADAGIELPDGIITQIARLEEQGKTTMVLATRDPEVAIWGILGLADTVRPDAREAIAALKRAGIERTVMLTGDNRRTAAAIAAQAGMDEFRANLLPEQKVGAIEELLEAHGQVAMVGDGVNDAPALARASVGIAMGGAGTDQALETADVVLMADDLTKLPYAMNLSRRALRIVRQNMIFSLVIKGVFLLLALPGLATLWMAVFADMGASLLVTLNGMRLLRDD